MDTADEGGGERVMTTQKICDHARGSSSGKDIRRLSFVKSGEPGAGDCGEVTKAQKLAENTAILICLLTWTAMFTAVGYRQYKSQGKVKNI